MDQSRAIIQDVTLLSVQNHDGISNSSSIVRAEISTAAFTPVESDIRSRNTGLQRFLPLQNSETSQIKLPTGRFASNSQVAYDNVQFVIVGCLSVTNQQSKEFMNITADAGVTYELACARQCAARAYRIVGVDNPRLCWCADELINPVQNTDVGGQPCVHCNDIACGVTSNVNNRKSSLWRITSLIPEIITVYVAPAKRTSSMFTTGRLEPFYSGTYAYRKRGLNAQILKSPERFQEEVCDRVPGKKIFVQIVGAVSWLLEHWPDNSLLVITGDEIGNWGLGNGERRFGPHGPGRPFSTNETAPFKHIILPSYVFPIFKQYHHYKQEASFGSNVRFIPLGSRNEFPSTNTRLLIDAPLRKFVYSFMAAITDGSRAKVYSILMNDTVFREEQRFVKVSQNWHASANNEAYVSPKHYQEIMQQSSFAICPKGHSVEQFRIYEAIESGAIPVMELKDGYLAQHLPSEYLSSPMLFVDRWDHVLMHMRELWDTPEALKARQVALLKWYKGFMQAKVRELEIVLESRADETPRKGSCKDPKHI